MTRCLAVWPLLVLIACEPGERPSAHATDPGSTGPAVVETETEHRPTLEKIVKSDEEWREQLTPEQYRIARQAGTERAGTGKYLHNKQQGVYNCVCCGLPLFASDTKYDSGSGWPSYYQPIAAEHITEHRDTSHGMVRTEVVCSRCDAHLGHVFPDGPRPTGLRYCINSASLKFDSQEGEHESK